MAMEFFPLLKEAVSVAFDTGRLFCHLNAQIYLNLSPFVRR